MYLLAIAISLSTAAPTVSPADLERFRASEIVYVGFEFASPRSIDIETKMFAKKYEKEFTVETIETDRAILRWKVLPTRELVVELKMFFDRVVPGGSKVRK